MLKRLLALAAIAIFVVGLGCTGGSTPMTPDKVSQSSPEEYFNQFDLSNPTVAEYTYYDVDGNVLATGLLGRNDDGLYLIEGRGAEIDVDLAPLHLIAAFVTYNNPAGTIPTGPNAGLPYYYIGQTIDYDVNLLSMLATPIGGFDPPFGWSGPAEMVAEMRYAAFDADGKVVGGALLPGLSTFNWSGIISPGYQVVNDLFLIVPGTVAGLDVTTVRITAPVFLGAFDIIFFDGVAGIWDPQ